MCAAPYRNTKNGIQKPVHGIKKAWRVEYGRLRQFDDK